MRTPGTSLEYVGFTLLSLVDAQNAPLHRVPYSAAAFGVPSSNFTCEIVGPVGTLRAFRNCDVVNAAFE